MVLLHYGVTRDIMYDPGFPEWNNDTNWNDSSGPGVRDIGYAFTLPGTTWIAMTNQNTFLILQPIAFANILLPAPDSSLRVLIAGCVISPGNEYQTDAASRSSYQYTKISADDGSLFARTSHLAGTLTAGDNIAMLDGSASWRKFQNMVPRSFAGGWCTWWW